MRLHTSRLSDATSTAGCRLVLGWAGSGRYMRYRLRYNVGPLFGDGPFRSPRPAGGILATIVSVLWYVVAFVAQLVVWAVLLVVGLVYTLVWLIVWPFHRRLG
jgi:hypothetical protein